MWRPVTLGGTTGVPGQIKCLVKKTNDSVNDTTVSTKINDSGTI